MAEELNQEQQIGQAEDYDGSQIQVLKAWKRCASARACISGPPGPGSASSGV